MFVGGKIFNNHLKEKSRNKIKKKEKEKINSNLTWRLRFSFLVAAKGLNDDRYDEKKCVVGGEAQCLYGMTSVFPTWL